MTKQSEVLNQFGFFVDKKANKVQIKKAVEAAKKYKPTTVFPNSENRLPKKKSRAKAKKK